MSEITSEETSGEILNSNTPPEEINEGVLEEIFEGISETIPGDIPNGLAVGTTEQIPEEPGKNHKRNL